VPLEIPILIVIASIGIIIFIAFVIVFVLFYQKRTLQNKALAEEKEKNHQRQLVNTTIEITEIERKRIASNLHDDIGGIVNLVKLNIGKISRSTQNETIVKELSEQSSALLETTMENVRSISRDLAPPVLLRLGFEEGLMELCRYINNSGALKAGFNGSKEKLKLSSKTELQLYRIINEVINNIIKHDSADNLQMDIINYKDKFAVTIKHDGKGIDDTMLKELTEGSKGIGLKSIQSRASILNAKINYSKSDAGSLITIETPLHEQSN
jgi:signal transduction histidine kinase